MVDVLDIIIGDVRNVEMGSEGVDIVDGSSLRMIDSYNFLSDVGRVIVYVNVDIINVGGDEGSSLFVSYDVFVNDIKFREVFFYLFDYFNLIYVVILRVVKYDNI